MQNTRSHPRIGLSLSTITVTGLLLAGCGSASSQAAADGSSASAGASASSSSGKPAAGGNERQVAALSPRIVFSYDGGLSTLDAKTGKVVDETAHPGFLRVANAGNGRHVVVTDSDVFRVYDAGIEADKHGDHHHYREYTPGLTDVSYPAPHAGHVVLHAGLTNLFADGSGAIQIVDSGSIADPGATVRHAKTANPHHGVALELADGTLLTTQGTEDKRSTVQLLDGEKVVTQTMDCVGVHGEGTAQPTTKGEVVGFGCENGPVVFRDGAFHKVPVKETYARVGNLAGSAVSPVLLSDYKVDKDAEPERPTRVALIDTRKDSLSLVELGSAYWFRSLARGPKGEGVVLTYDGALKIVDPATKAVTASIPVISPWTENKDWQQPGPAVKVVDDTAYVSDPAQRKIFVVDLATRKVEKAFDLAHAPVEMAVVTGSPEAPKGEPSAS